MAATMTIPNTTQATGTTQLPLLVSLPSMAHESLQGVLRNLEEAFPQSGLIVATPDAGQDEGSQLSQEIGGPQVVGYTPSAPPSGAWLQTAADYLNAHALATKYRAKAVMLLGGEAQSLAPAALRRLADYVLRQDGDLAMPRYALPAGAGLVNSAILYPMSRALFSTRCRYPLAIDLCLSARMAERMATMAQKQTAANQPDGLLWPCAEAAVANFKISEVEAGARALPAPTHTDLNTLLAEIAGSLFADIDQKAAFWQRARVSQGALLGGANAEAPTADVRPMIEAFALAYGNLHELWALVLPPQSLFGLKKLAAMPHDAFRMGESLWARIVYDFLLAYRLRTINRGHLLGALTPLYLAWAASHLLLAEAGTDPEQHVELQAAAFESDKAYLVSRWRWPDRFNP